MAWGTDRAWAGGSTRAWRTIRGRVLNRDNHTCTLAWPKCTHTATEVDHIISKADGGTDTLNNLRAVCPNCHKARTQQQARGARPTKARPAEAHPALRRHPPRGETP